MAWYRFYLLEAGRHIVAREDFEADSDESAIAIAHQLYQPVRISARASNSGAAIVSYSQNRIKDLGAEL